MLRTIKEESEERGVAPSTLRGWIQRGAAAVLVAGTTYVRPEDIDAFLEAEDDEETPDEELEPDDDEESEDDDTGVREELAALRERLDELESDLCDNDDDDDDD